MEIIIYQMRKGGKRRSLYPIYGWSSREFTQTINKIYINSIVLRVCVKAHRCMLDIRSYTRKELIEIFNTNRFDSIKGKLNRQGYEFISHGRGETATIEIIKKPSRFIRFCVDELGFAPQTDFEKLKRFLYKYMFDDDFRQLPYNGMKDIMVRETIISNPTITNYVRKLYSNNMIGYGDSNYYSINKELSTYTPITEQQYKEAWKIYWEYRDGGYSLAFVEMCNHVNGYPFKNDKVIFNAFEMAKIAELEEILLEEYNENERYI